MEKTNDIKALKQEIIKFIEAEKSYRKLEYLYTFTRAYLKPRNKEQ